MEWVTRARGSADVGSFDTVHLIAHLRLGAGRYVVDAARQQARCVDRDVRVMVTCDVDAQWRSDPALVGELANDGIAVDVLPDFFHRDLRALGIAAGRLRHLVAGRVRPLIAHAHTAMAAAIARWAGADLVVATCHGHGAGRSSAFELQDALAYHLCDAVTTPSSHWAARLADEMGVNAAIVPVGLDFRRLPVVFRRPRKPADPLRVVTVGELTARKGVDLLIAAMPTVWARDPSVELHVIGNGDAAAALREQARAVDRRGERIVFHGRLTDPYRRLDEFDLFALTSRSDNLPVAIIEAMLAGLPVLATDVGGIAEMVRPASCGLITDDVSADAVGVGLLELVGAGREVLADLGEKGERFARARYAIEVTDRMMQRVYREAWTRASRSGPVMPATTAGAEALEVDACVG